MRLNIVKSPNAKQLYVIKSYRVNGKNTSKIVKKLGTYDELLKTHEDPIAWAKEYIAELNRKEAENKKEVILKYSNLKLIDKNNQTSFNGGYLFLQDIYHKLALHKICKEISKKYNFGFDLNSILSRLVYSRILFPASKLATMELSKKFIEQPNFDLHQIYRALDVIAKENDFIQSELYKNSLNVIDRNTGILYYDCTNYFFEIEHEEGLKQYGISKEHRPNPIVQMGLFMDGSGIPLAFCINEGNKNEQQTLKPLEKKIISDFGKSKFVVCTDAGLSSTENRKFNNISGRAFVTTQSIKILKGFLKEWALNPDGWSLSSSKEKFNIDKIDEEQFEDSTFFKERWINENGLKQRLIVTYSIKYRKYQQAIRDEQIARALKLLNTNPGKIEKGKQTDYKRFITKTAVTSDGEHADKKIYSIDEKAIEDESKYDGFYGVCTNLEDEVKEIIKVNKRRWEIEESFRIMKSEFKARPVYLSRDNRITAHFATCFMSLMIYRILKHKLGEYTTDEILTCIKEMNFYKLKGEGYIPTYTRTDLTDALHEKFNFRTDYQIVDTKNMKNILKITKS